MKKIILKSKRLVLRTVKLLDAPDYTRWFNDDEVIKFLGWQNWPSLKKEQKILKEKLKMKNKFTFTVLLKNKSIGFVSFNIFNSGNYAHTVMAIGEKDEWGYGYGREALELVIDYLFKKMKMNRVELEVFTDNKRGIKVYKRIGFRKEGIRRQCHWNLITKKYDDNMMMSILKKEWKNKK